VFFVSQAGISLRGKVNRIVTRLITRGVVVLRLQEFGSLDLKPDRCVALHQNELSSPDGRSGTPVPITRSASPGRGNGEMVLRRAGGAMATSNSSLGGRYVLPQQVQPLPPSVVSLSLHWYLPTFISGEGVEPPSLSHCLDLLLSYSSVLAVWCWE